MFRNSPQAWTIVAAMAALSAASPSAAQVGGVVSGTVRTGASVTTVVPRVGTHATTATQASTRLTTGATRVTGTGLAAIRSAVSESKQALLTGIALTAEQSAAIEGHAETYARSLEASAKASTEAGAEVSGQAVREVQNDARDQRREAAARFRAAVRSVLTAEQQVHFDANVRAGATAEVEMEETSVRAEQRVEGSASTHAGERPLR